MPPSPIRKKAREDNPILSLLYGKSALFRNQIALSERVDGQWRDWSFRHLQRSAKDLSEALITMGVEDGDRIAVLSESSPLFGVTFFAAVRAGAIIVPLETKLTDTEIKRVITDARPRLIIASQAFAERARALAASMIPKLAVHVLWASAGPGFEPLPGLPRRQREQGRVKGLDDPAVIVYTSGSTGNPKGVVVSFRTLIFQVERLEKIVGRDKGDVFLSILPMSHLLELTAGFLAVLYAGGRVCYAPSLYPEDITQAMRQNGVTLMVTVPMFLKLMKSHLEREIKSLPPALHARFRVLYSIARFVPSHRARRKLFAKLIARIGGRLRGFVCGGAALDPEVLEFFDRLGIPVYVGYGLTETGPIVSANTPRHYRPGSVGRPLNGVEVKIAASEGQAEGEILTRGPHLMQGYYKQDELTRQTIDSDGWLHTGDIGKLDADGFLYITGRKKNLIVLPGGKKVQAEEVEEALSHSTMLKEVCVIGTRARAGLAIGAEEVCAVVVPAEMPPVGRGEMAKLESALHRHIEHVLADLAPYKHPTRVVIHSQSLPKTCTAKVNRLAVIDWLNQEGASR